MFPFDHFKKWVCESTQVPKPWGVYIHNLMVQIHCINKHSVSCNLLGLHM
jgi:hypothetical protein